MICRLGMEWKALLNENSGNMIVDAITSWKNKYIQFLQARERLRGWDHVEEKPHQDEDLLGQCLVDILASIGKSYSDA